jgi:hypothetical protein
MGLVYLEDDEGKPLVNFRHYNDDVETWGTASCLNDATAHPDTRPQIAFNGRSYLAVWTDEDSGEVMGTILSESGVEQTDDRVLSRVGDGYDAIALTGWNSVFAVVLAGAVSGGREIFVVLVDPDTAEPMRDPITLVADSLVGFPEQVAAAHASFMTSGTSLALTWSDSGGSEAEVYYQNFVCD